MITFIITLGLLKLLVAVFIDALLTEKSNKEKMKVDQQGQLKTELETLVDAMFTTFDIDETGFLSGEHLERGLSFIDTEETRQLLLYAGLDQSILQSAGEICNQDGSGKVSRKDFKVALNSITSAPRQADVTRVYQYVVEMEKHLMKELKEQIGVQQHAMEDVQATLKLILDHLGIARPRTPQ